MSSAASAGILERLVDYRLPKDRKSEYEMAYSSPAICDVGTFSCHTIGTRPKKTFQQCHEEGKKSWVHPGVSSTTLMYFQPYYDEEGKYHNHDGNTTITNYSCSNGRSWIESSTGACWCGWGKD